MIPLPPPIGEPPKNSRFAIKEPIGEPPKNSRFAIKYGPKPGLLPDGLSM